MRIKIVIGNELMADAIIVMADLIFLELLQSFKDHKDEHLAKSTSAPSLPQTLHCSATCWVRGWLLGSDDYRSAILHCTGAQ